MTRVSKVRVRSRVDALQYRAHRRLRLLRPSTSAPNSSSRYRYLICGPSVAECSDNIIGQGMGFGFRLFPCLVRLVWATSSRNPRRVRQQIRTWTAPNSTMRRRQLQITALLRKYYNCKAETSAQSESAQTVRLPGTHTRITTFEQHDMVSKVVSKTQIVHTERS